MGSPSYGLDIVALTLAVVLAAAIVVLVHHIMPQLAELMMVPPPLSGSPYMVALAALDGVIGCRRASSAALAAQLRCMAAATVNE